MQNSLNLRIQVHATLTRTKNFTFENSEFHPYNGMHVSRNTARRSTV
jgi:hypothetical protein